MVIIFLIIPCKWRWRISISFFRGLYAKSSAAQIRRMLRRLCIFQSFAKSSVGLILEKRVLARGGLCSCWQKAWATWCFFCAEQLVPVFVVHLDLEYGFSPHDYQLLLNRILSRTCHNVKCFASARLSNWLENLTPL